VIGLEVEPGQRPARVNAHADPDIADRDLVGPFRRRRAGIVQFGQDSEAGDVERSAFRASPA
jgi:hypothetical protein